MDIEFLQSLTSGLRIQLLVFANDGTRLFSHWSLQPLLGEAPTSFEEVLAWLGDNGDAAQLKAQFKSNALTDFHSEFAVQREDVAYHFRVQFASVVWQNADAVAVQVTDVTREYNFFREMELLERQASAGQMAAGVAHEFNNILTAMMGWTQLAVRAVDGNDSALMALSTIDNNTKRARRIAAELLDITSPAKSIESHALYLGDVVKEALKLLSWELTNQQINVVEEIFETSPSMGNTTRLVQVFVNIIKNAMDAMSLRGTLGVRVLEKNSSVIATISDTGEGISDENIDKVFRPFFTTKSRDDKSHGGSGLGMAISKRIVEEFNGTIRIARSLDEGMGSVVTVTLPAYEDIRESVHDEPRTPSSFPPGVAVLVVDDEPDICEMIRMALSLRGAHVVSATNGEDALEMCRRELFNAAFLDFSMTGLSGHELKDAISGVQPSLPIVFMSGVDIPSLTHQEDFLKKPFDLHDIQCKLREILER